METNIKTMPAKEAGEGIAPLIGLLVFIGLIIWAIIEHSAVNADFGLVGEEYSSLFVKYMSILGNWGALVVLPAAVSGVIASFVTTIIICVILSKEEISPLKTQKNG